MEQWLLLLVQIVWYEYGQVELVPSKMMFWLLALCRRLSIHWTLVVTCLLGICLWVCRVLYSSMPSTCLGALTSRQWLLLLIVFLSWDPCQGWKNILNNLRLILQLYVYYCLLFPWLFLYDIPGFRAGFLQLIGIMNSLHAALPFRQKRDDITLLQAMSSGSSLFSNCNVDAMYEVLVKTKSIGLDSIRGQKR